MGGHQRALSRNLTQCNLHFSKITLVAVLRIDCRGTRGQAVRQVRKLF